MSPDVWQHTFILSKLFKRGRARTRSIKSSRKTLHEVFHIIMNKMKLIARLLSNHFNRLFIRAFISSLTSELVNGLLLRWGSAEAAIKATTEASCLYFAAKYRGVCWTTVKTFTFAPASKRTGTTAGFCVEAKCKGDSWALVTAWTSAPASIRTWTNSAEHLYQGARCRTVVRKIDLLCQKMVVPIYIFTVASRQRMFDQDFFYTLIIWLKDVKRGGFDRETFRTKGVLSGPICTILLHISNSSYKFYKLKSDLLAPLLVQKNDFVFPRWSY